MKKIILLIVFSAGILLSALAQEDDPKGDAGRIEAYRIAYLTKKLNLTPEEAQKFWPLYNKYQNELRAARREYMQKNGTELELQEKQLEIRKRYNGEFGKALSTEKIDKLYKSEKEFMNILQKEYQDRRNQRLNNQKRNRQ